MREFFTRTWIKTFGYLLAPASKRFHTALANPEQAQKQVQQHLVQQLKNCEYGHQFNIRSSADWHRLPIVDYADLQPQIAVSTQKESPLTPEPILFYEPTSGSSGPIKRVPYTRSLRRSFNHLFCVWAHDLIAHGPTFSKGKLYFSISPSFSDKGAEGTTDDADYLDPWLRWLLKPFLVIAPVSKSPEVFKENLAKTLLQAENLEIISIWSPSFLTAQLDYIFANRERLAGDLSEERSHLLLQSKIPWAKLWPHLKLISCWDSMTAADGANGLRQYFPDVLTQGKGLLATEAPMTVPLVAAKGQVPLLDEIFFEFESLEGNIYRLHELLVGETYEIIISQKGGLYRYRMGDRVQVTHHYLKTPCLKFVGRGKDVSDLVGEKLHVQFVSSAIGQLNISEATFQCLLPIREPTAHYVLLLDFTEKSLQVIAQQLEHELCKSYHYRLARQLGQLAPVRAIASVTIIEQLSAQKAKSGQRWGDIKHTLLETAASNLSWLNEIGT